MCLKVFLDDVPCSREVVTVERKRWFMKVKGSLERKVGEFRGRLPEQGRKCRVA